MFRRTFIGKSAAAASTFFMNIPLMDIRDKKNKKTLIKPAPIPAGATIALIAPASPPADAKIEKALTNLSAMGFKVKEGMHLRSKYGYLAGSDADRVADIHAAFTDPEVAAIWCVRGGYGCTRFLDLLDYDLIRKHPKPLIGYSDITAMHIALYQQAGLVSFHGQVGGGDMTEYTLRHIQMSLMDIRSSPLGIPTFYQNMRPTDDYQPFMVRGGKAEGPLIGGNLTLLAVMSGTSFAPKFKDHIVFIEEIGEAPYRVDRMLTQLIHGSDLKKAKGIVLGIFTDCIQKSDAATLNIRECIHDRLGNLGIPVYYGAPFGHISDQCVIPYGIQASIDADRMEMTFLESGLQR